MINEKEIRDIPLESIIPNRFQPRELFNEDDLKELAASIKEHGVIQPIIVRQVGDKFEIIAGERRYKASQLAGKSTIPCVVRELDDIKSSKIALLENLQRKDLTAIEEAKTYQTILKIGGMTQEELATSLGISQSAIANKIRLLTLDNDVQNALLTEQISERHARSLLNVQDVNKQKALLAKIIQNRMTVRELDDEILKMNSTDSITNQFVENNGDNSDEGGEAPYLTSVNPNNMNVDAEKIRHRAVDINPENFVDMNELLKSNKPVEQPKPVSNNMFIPENEPPTPVEEPKQKINPIDIQPTPAV
jgi:ParB/RepB/Spo0J family partition protein